MADRGREADGAGEEAASGTYTLLVELDTPATITFGAAGTRELPAGWLAYTGSALGPGGFARIGRHRRVAAGDHDVRHWHVDYLLGHPAARLVDDVRSADLDAECEVARAIAIAPGIESVSGIGATDCGCGSHLAAGSDPAAIEGAVREAHGRASG